MTGFQKGTNDRPQNEAGTFALRLVVGKTETICPSDHASQRNQVTRLGPAGTPCAGRYDGEQAGSKQSLHSGLDREGKDSVDGREGDDDGRLALQQRRASTSTLVAVQYCIPCDAVGYRGPAMTHVIRWFECPLRKVYPCPGAILHRGIPTGWLSSEDSECHDAIPDRPNPGHEDR